MLEKMGFAKLRIKRHVINREMINAFEVMLLISFARLTPWILGQRIKMMNLNDELCGVLLIHNVDQLR